MSVCFSRGSGYGSDTQRGYEPRRKDPDRRGSDYDRKGSDHSQRGFEPRGRGSDRHGPDYDRRSCQEDLSHQEDSLVQRGRAQDKRRSSPREQLGESHKVTASAQVEGGRGGENNRGSQQVNGEPPSLTASDVNEVDGTTRYHSPPREMLPSLDRPRACFPRSESYHYSDYRQAPSYPPVHGGGWAEYYPPEYNKDRWAALDYDHDNMRRSSGPSQFSWESERRSSGPYRPSYYDRRGSLPVYARGHSLDDRGRYGERHYGGGGGGYGSSVSAEDWTKPLPQNERLER